MRTYANTPPREKPSLSRKKLKMFALLGLVRISATCSSVGKYLRMACFIDTTSCTKQTLRSMHLCAARATGAPLDGSGVVFEDHCWLPLLVVEITQYTTNPYHVLSTTRSSDVFCPCSGQSDAALLLARPVHKIFTAIMQRARCLFAVDVATPVGVRVCNECRLSSSTMDKTIITRPRKVAH
jgi:hypothetical protein